MLPSSHRLCSRSRTFIHLGLSTEPNAQRTKPPNLTNCVILGQLTQLLWAPQWKVWKERQGVRALTPYPLSWLCARTPLWDELWRDGPQSLTCWPVRGRMWRLETGCNEFSSLLSSRRKFYGWINSVMNWVKQGSPSPRTSNSGNQMKQ